MGGIKEAIRGRVLQDMLGSIQDSTGGGWRVLILDNFCTRVMSSALKMSDILDCNVSVVEDLAKPREALPLAAVYFIQPSPASIAQLLDDFSGYRPLYQSVHIFFSSQAPSGVISRIKACEPLLAVLKTLKESNLEYLCVDSRTLVTDQPHAPLLLLGDQADTLARDGDRELDCMSLRLATALATLNEFPTVRYRRSKAPGPWEPPGSQARSTLPERLAARVLAHADAMQRAGQLPAKESCEVLILDRSYDPLAPVIHEWTYEAMVYDLLPLEHNTYRYTAESMAGKSEEKGAVLDEGDTLWAELRHTFIAEVYNTLASRFKEFQSKNKAAKLGGKEKGEMSNSSIRQLIVALPQYRELLSKLSLHIQMSSDLRTVTTERLLTDVGELEQDLVLGEKTSKDLMAFLQENQRNLSADDKVRLLMCYCVTHPEKLDATKLGQWQQLAGLRQEDLTPLCNLTMLGVSVFKSSDKAQEKSSFFGSNKKKDRKDLIRQKKQEDGGYALFRVDPLLKDILSAMSTNRLPQEDFPYVRAPSAAVDAAAAAQSARTARPGLNWAKRDVSAGTTSGPSGAKRVLVFVIGGVVRSEMRVVHEMSKQIGKDIILGSTSVETPHSYLEKMYGMSTAGKLYTA